MCKQVAEATNVEARQSHTVLCLCSTAGTTSDACKGESGVRTSSKETLAAGESLGKVLGTASPEHCTSPATDSVNSSPAVPKPQHPKTPEPVEMQSEQGNPTCTEGRSLAPN